MTGWTYQRSSAILPNPELNPNMSFYQVDKKRSQIDRKLTLKRIFLFGEDVSDRKETSAAPAPRYRVARGRFPMARRPRGSLVHLAADGASLPGSIRRSTGS